MVGNRQRRVMTADGVDLNVVESGDADAPALVLIHGTAGSVRAWTKQLNDPTLTDVFRVVAVDLRGHGASQKDLAADQLTGDDPEANARLWSLDLDAVVHGLRTPVIVGWSFGCTVAQSWVYAHGGLGKTVAVVLLSGPPAVLLPAPEGDMVAQLLIPEAIRDLFAAAQGFKSSIYPLHVGGQTFAAYAAVYALAANVAVAVAVALTLVFDALGVARSANRTAAVAGPDRGSARPERDLMPAS